MSSVHCDDGFSDHQISPETRRSLRIEQFSPIRREKVETWFEGPSRFCLSPDADGEAEDWVDEIPDGHETPETHPDVGHLLSSIPGAWIGPFTIASNGGVETYSGGARDDEELGVRRTHKSTTHDKGVASVVDHTENQVSVLSIIACVSTCVLFIGNPRQFLDLVLLCLLFATLPHFAHHSKYCLLIAIAFPDLKVKLKCAMVFGCLAMWERLDLLDAGRG
ncbi:hypothetical protein AYO21_05737 [Fonsecaea monophora]|uniref:Uncharacterized protein n=1 Tax=Fonsecaea monophora TaxID=254056 RepID=A0A177F8G2_9EURO|nr:hypothetical protein AYO21_05737 [Fonsecaea monophora]OAG40056.1 hypothetical protein AYO21_05737 [Fonsecaea monophora]